jgi:hypothetical protein
MPRTSFNSSSRRSFWRSYGNFVFRRNDFESDHFRRRRILSIGTTCTQDNSMCLRGSLSRPIATGPDSWHSLPRPIRRSLSRPIAVAPDGRSSRCSRYFLRPLATTYRAAIELAPIRSVPPNPTTHVAARTLRISPNNAVTVVEGGEPAAVSAIHAGVVRATGVAVAVG